MSIREEIFETAAKACRVDPATLSDETRLNEDLRVKSAHLFAIIATIEEITGETVAFGEIRKLKTLGEIVSLAENLNAK
jgi:acyl carrier protein